MLLSFMLTHCVRRGCSWIEEINLNKALYFLVKMSFIFLKLQPCNESPCLPKSSVSVPALVELHTGVSKASSLGTCGLCAASLC